MADDDPALLRSRDYRPPDRTQHFRGTARAGGSRQMPGRMRTRPRCRQCHKAWRKMSTTQLGLCGICAGDVWPRGRPRMVKVATPRASALCSRCGDRYAQEAGLCRTCQREAGLIVPRVVDLERSHLAREAATFDSLRREFVPREVRTVLVDGLEFEVQSSSARLLEAGELEREIDQARNPTGWSGNGGLCLTRHRP